MKRISIFHTLRPSSAIIWNYIRIIWPQLIWTLFVITINLITIDSHRYTNTRTNRQCQFDITISIDTHFTERSFFWPLRLKIKPDYVNVSHILGTCYVWIHMWITCINSMETMEKRCYMRLTPIRDQWIRHSSNHNRNVSIFFYAKSWFKDVFNYKSSIF